MPVEAVIFDMDGVLAMTAAAHWEAWREMARQRGVEIKYETFLFCFGRINPDCVPILFGDGISAEESASIADRKEAAFRDIIRRDVPLADGAVAILQRLRTAGIKVAVGSAAPPANVDLVLDAGKIRHLFDAVVHGDEVANGKPAPDIFLLAAARMGIEAGNCAVIEDAPTGIRAAIAGGMLPIGVATTHTAKQMWDAGAKEVYPTLAAVPVERFISRQDG